MLCTPIQDIHGAHASSSSGVFPTRRLRWQGGQGVCTMSSRSSGWRPPRRRGESVARSAMAAARAAALGGTAADLGTETPAFELAAPHDAFELSMPYCAQQLWASDYTPVFEREYEASRERCGSGYELPPSSYAARGLSGERLEAYQRKMRHRERDLMAAALHGSNMRLWTPSMMARSVCAISSSRFSRRVESRGARMASQPTTFKFLRMMRAVQPPTYWTRGRHVSLYIADQTYEWIGMKKRGRRQAVSLQDLNPGRCLLPYAYASYIHERCSCAPCVPLIYKAAAHATPVLIDCSSPLKERPKGTTPMACRCASSTWCTSTASKSTCPPL
jgi:hypothetical protein